MRSQHLLDSAQGVPNPHAVRSVTQVSLGLSQSTGNGTQNVWLPFGFALKAQKRVLTKDTPQPNVPYGEQPKHCVPEQTHGRAANLPVAIGGRVSKSPRWGRMGSPCPGHGKLDTEPLPNISFFPRSSSREVRIRVLFSVYFSRGTLPPKKGERRALLGDLVSKFGGGVWFGGCPLEARAQPPYQSTSKGPVLLSQPSIPKPNHQLL